MSNKSTALTLTPEIQEAFQPAVLEVIRTSLCPTASDAEFLLFAHKAASYGLDPFKNEIFFIKYGQQARIQFAAEAYLSKAREKEGFQPPDTQTVCANDTFRAKKYKNEKGEDEWEVIEHEVTFPRGAIVGAYSIAYRDGKRPVTVFVDKEHIAHMYTGQNKDNWNKWEPDMIGKHAEQRALKKQYGLEFGDDQLNQQPEYVTNPYERRDVTAESTESEPLKTIAPDKGDKEETPVDRTKALKTQIKAKYQALGLKDKSEFDAHAAEFFQVKGEIPTEPEIIAYLKIMDQQIQAAADDLPV
ncbi:hypothetical protein PAECIP112173_00378 [Paenibacillus sp. JJ-100]|uniref:RecT family recombinase n=1 Tax=Paenibacillus sp. JJ-100 TaxID=2974896 RepID=UPI0022FF7120|nr:RecT family recombinase [Paenibacillus sp. JJ-100]CAI6024307.1 hypothetical protein PAECIP112173_00378 [Paenibacillus sp. JJ-100]